MHVTNPLNGIHPSLILLIKKKGLGFEKKTNMCNAGALQLFLITPTDACTHIIIVNNNNDIIIIYYIIIIKKAAKSEHWCH